MIKRVGWLLAGMGVVFCGSILTVTQAATFACPDEKVGVCLDPDDQVCLAHTKCVDRDAVCFDLGTCDEQGFVCKSQVDGIVRDYQEVLGQSRRLTEKYNTLVRKYNDLLARYKTMEQCVAAATTIAEARVCANRFQESVY